MIDHDRAARAAAAGLEIEGADAVEVLVTGSNIGLTRFANSEIIQNTVRETLNAHVRVVADGNRVAQAATNRLTPDGVKECARAALEVARAAPPDELFPGFPSPDAAASPIHRFDQRTADASPARRADAVETILRFGGDLSVAGIYETSSHTFSVFNTEGVDRHDAYTRCVVTCLADNGEATGWGEAAAHSASGVDVEDAVRRAAAKAETGRDPADAAPGTYEVVLEPAAAVGLIEMLSYYSIGAKQVLDGESFLATKTGRQVASSEVSIIDDAFHDNSIGISFDLEGSSKKSVRVIDNGVALGPVTDLRTAKQLDVDPTGHYSGSNEYGPWASNLVVQPGDATIEEMISNIESGLFVTRFHYVNVLDAPETLLTGMTRDGTFRIENGELAGAVRNLRFTQSILGALATTRAVGADLTTFVPDYTTFGSFAVPSLHVGEFRFDSTTSH